MLRLETKKIIGYLALVLLAFFILPKLSFATDYSSSTFTVKDPVIDNGGKSSASLNFGLGQSFGQPTIGKSTSTSFQLWNGFQYFFSAVPNTLTATPSSGSVGLSWTVPATFLGITVTSYDVGVSTVSGSYTFTSVGNVTTYNQTGLTNGTPYFFRIKAKSAGGGFVVMSNEATATPFAVTPPPPPPPPPGGGGGGPPNPTPPPTPTPTPVNASIVLSGLASPGASVFVLKDGAVAATTTADPTAGFVVSLSNLPTGSYSFTLYAEDIKGVRTSSTSFLQAITSGVTTTTSNIFLGPSIGVDFGTVKQGDTLNIFGYTAPSTDVTVFVHSEGQFAEHVTAAASGAWFKAFNTSVLELGDHTTRSQAALENMLSIYSNTLSFKVGDQSIPAEQCKRSDLNCDGRVNLTDFSILLFYWQKSNPANARADINKDTIVNLTDFSILLYDWTG